MAIHSLFEKYDTRKDGKLDEKQMTFFLEEALGLEYEQAQIYFFLVDNSYEGSVHTYPDLFESATFSFRIRLSGIAICQFQGTSLRSCSCFLSHGCAFIK